MVKGLETAQSFKLAMRFLRRMSICITPMFSLVLLSGCVTHITRQSSDYPSEHAVHGRVHGGQQPVAAAQIQLYTVGVTGDQSASSPLLSVPVKTDAGGNFDITGLYKCPSAESLVYLTASGGNPGLVDGTNNKASVLMLVLGPCGDIGSDYIVVNEASTVASIYPITQFMSSFTNIGSSAGDAPLLADAFARTQQFIDLGGGTSPGPSAQPGYTVPSASLYALANSLSACVNSSGGTAGDGSSCGDLFVDATPLNGMPPTNTADATLLIAEYPLSNVTAIYDLAQPTAPFEPALSAAPADWTLKITPNSPLQMPERQLMLGEYLLDEGKGNIAHDSSGNGYDALLQGTTWDGQLDLNFSVISQYVELPNSLNQGLTWQVAFYNPVFGSATLPQAPGYPGPFMGYPVNPILLCGTDSQSLCLLDNSISPPGTGGPKPFRFEAITTDKTESATVFPYGWHVLTYICGGQSGGTTSKTHILYDGSEVPAYINQGDVSTCPAPKAGNYQLGGTGAYPGGGFLGKIGAVWSWNTSLTLSEGANAAAAALQFLEDKGVQTHFTNVTRTRPLIIGGLDSRTYGFGVTPQTVWLKEMELTDPSYSRVNLGIPSQLAYDACLQFGLTYAEQIGDASYPTITIIWGGVNDYGLGESLIPSNLQCMVTQAKALGSKVILATEIGAYGTSFDQQKNALDSNLRANAYSWGVDNLVDLATDPLLGADNATSNTSCFPDQIHPGPNCEPRVTTMMEDAVNELLGSTSTSHNQTANSMYQEVAGDDFLDLTGSIQVVTLPSCIGYSLPRRIFNQGPQAAMIVAPPGQTFNGNPQVGPGTTATISPVPGNPSTGGCSWSRDT